MSPSDTIHDVLVIGGGINGVGIAYEAAKRGASVCLCEQYDFASGTSSASSKLIHGGLRYLEHYEFLLVRKALKEREVLMQIAPHLVTPLRFQLPHRPFLRPAWMIRCGLFLYDHLYFGRTLPGSSILRRPESSPLKSHLSILFEYSDCWTDDSRLVIANALAARNHGASLMRDARCISVNFDRQSQLWVSELKDRTSDHRMTVRSRHIVNASGPWMNRFFSENLPDFKPRHRVRLVKGSHLIVRKIEGVDRAYILQNEDKRIVFVLPYLQHFTLIGTTDRIFQGQPEEVKIDDWETDYLLRVVNDHFQHQLSATDVVASYSGVRPLLDDESTDPSQTTRDYTLDSYQISPANTLLSVYGGKITTYRVLAEAAVNQLFATAPALRNCARTDLAALPGAEFPGQTLTQISQSLRNGYPWLDTELLERYAHSYGLLAHQFLKGCASRSDMGQHFGAGLYEVEVNYLRQHEWAVEADDIVWRRSRLGLFMTAAEIERLAGFMKCDTQDKTSDRMARVSQG
jgi:glycerol-3-phosphate dehydrogenase